MTIKYTNILRSHCRPLAPIPSGQTPKLVKLSDVRAVLFDVYGTLFVSGSGEVGITREASCKIAMASALDAVGFTVSGPLDRAVTYFFEIIEMFHATSKEQGIDYPEVQIDKVWHKVLLRLAADQGLSTESVDRVDLKQLAVEYEVRANPVWPMPGLLHCLRALRSEGTLLGIVSNAQFYTHLLFDALLDLDADELGFAQDLQFFSYQYGRAKPGSLLFDMAAKSLEKRGIRPSEAIYVGNDMLNDIYVAQSRGFRTALFAGDKRSLRLRKDDHRVKDVVPDVVLTTLGQISEHIVTR